MRREHVHGNVWIENESVSQVLFMTVHCKKRLTDKAIMAVCVTALHLLD